MGWATSDSEKKPQAMEYPYNKMLAIANILPNTSREFILLTGDLDPTRTWNTPITKWVHHWKSPRNGMVTYISMNYTYACPIAFENEVFKVKNPNYKAQGLKLPYPLTKKVLCPVFDKTLGKVTFILVGREVEQQMDFIMANDPLNFKGYVRISRMGEGLNTKYRLDAIPPFEYPIDLVQAQMISLPDLDTNLTPDEFRNKTGIDPLTFWSTTDQNIASGTIPPIDTSNWGVRFGVGVGVGSAVPIRPIQVPSPSSPSSPSSPLTFDDMLNVVCSTGMFKGKSIRDAFDRSGMPVIQFLTKGGNDLEKRVANELLTNFKPQLDALNKKELF
jgi:hypothetical protein